jgi:hypothetical protein
MEWQSDVISLCVGKAGCRWRWQWWLSCGESGSGFVDSPIAVQDKKMEWSVDRRHGHPFQNNAGSRINMQLSPPLAPAAQRHSSPLLLFCLTKSLHHRPSTTTRSLPVA